MYIVVGLGNPGNEYARTRHNVGFDVIDVIGEKQNIRLTKNAMHGLIGEGFAGGGKIVLAQRPTVFNTPEPGGGGTGSGGKTRVGDRRGVHDPISSCSSSRRRL
mgnify:CR=1 FL=1